MTCQRLRSVFASLITAALCFTSTGVSATPPPDEADVALFRTCVSEGCESVPDTGNMNAAVSIIVVSDFQCPFCQRGAATMEALAKRYGMRLHFSFLHNPLPFHKRAFDAAVASMAASRHGAFWQMHDRLFANPKKFSDADLKDHAAQSGVAPVLYETHIADPLLKAVVNRQIAIAKSVDAGGTPTFFVNGRVLKGALPMERFEEIIDDEMAKAKNQLGHRWLRKRLRENNPTLASYLLDQKMPEAIKPKPAVSKPAPKAPEPTWRVTVDPKIDAIKGPVDAPVTIVTFTDFECPFCKRLAVTLDALAKTHPEKVRLVFKHNPLSFHKRAKPASIAAICAGQQGKFWEMHDVIFENNKALSDADLRRYAKGLGLKMRPFKRCVDAGEASRQILADQALAASVNARGTPTSFVNGKALSGAQPAEKFESVIQAAHAAVEALEGVAKADVYDTLIAKGKVYSELDTTVHTLRLESAARKGPADAPVQITVASDFQCPYCARVDPILEAVIKELGSTVSVTFKHFPLSFHDAARPAAEAAECAGEQGKFWAYHDALFADQVMLDAFPWKELAEKAGVELSGFETCMAEGRYASKVNADLEEMRGVGIRGTPTIFINGRIFKPAGGLQVERFIQVINQEILAQ